MNQNIFYFRLRTLFVAGEHCDHETLTWAGKALNVSLKIKMLFIKLYNIE